MIPKLLLNVQCSQSIFSNDKSDVDVDYYMLRLRFFLNDESNCPSFYLSILEKEKKNEKH